MRKMVIMKMNIKNLYGEHSSINYYGNFKLNVIKIK